MRTVEDSSLIRSLVCWGVPTMVCARLSGARASVANSAPTTHRGGAPSLAGCMRQMTPKQLYPRKTQVDEVNFLARKRLPPGGEGLGRGNFGCGQMGHHEKE